MRNKSLTRDREQTRVFTQAVPEICGYLREKKGRDSLISISQAAERPRGELSKRAEGRPCHNSYAKREAKT